MKNIFIRSRSWTIHSPNIKETPETRGLIGIQPNCNSPWDKQCYLQTQSCNNPKFFETKNSCCLICQQMARLFLIQDSREQEWIKLSYSLEALLILRVHCSPQSYNGAGTKRGQPGAILGPWPSHWTLTR